MIQFPSLEPYCNSWVIVRRNDGAAVLETYSQRVAEAVNLTRYEVLTAAQYLARFNTNLRSKP